jgi:hypothetical protein
MEHIQRQHRQGAIEGVIRIRKIQGVAHFEHDGAVGDTPASIVDIPSRQVDARGRRDLRCG